MKIKVTVTGTLDLEAADVELLKKASPGEALDTMRYQAVDMKVNLGEPVDEAGLKAEVKGLKARIKELLDKGGKSKEK